ncbi:MAG TPA: tyrosinase family protein [Chthoniobacterales bacterium]|nr:tyrosinase family protein [Chthoniobacterales bacterium]
MSIYIRQNIENYTAEELTALRAGYTAMQAIADDRGFNVIAGYHGVPMQFCYHHEDPLMFFPWHRGYLLAFENRLRDIDAKLSVPYWDWTSPSSHEVGVPTAFSVQQLPDGSRNPLAGSMINITATRRPVRRRTNRFPGDPQDLPQPADVESTLSESDFTKFSNLVQDLHDGIHGWTGGQRGNVPGDMAVVPWSSYDPIFFSHHCMIDRIWYRWQQIHGVNNIPQSLLNRPLRGFDNLTVASVVDTTRLGYRYASDEITVEDHT